MVRCETGECFLSLHTYNARLTVPDAVHIQDERRTACRIHVSFTNTPTGDHSSPLIGRARDGAPADSISGDDPRVTSDRRQGTARGVGKDPRMTPTPSFYPTTMYTLLL